MGTLGKKNQAILQSNTTYLHSYELWHNLYTEVEIDLKLVN